MPKRSWTVSAPLDPLRGAAGDDHGIALHDEVQLTRRPPHQCVAHRAADDVDARLAGHGGEHDLGARGREQDVHAHMFH